MERILKILAIGVITFLIIFWISTGFSKCGSDKAAEETITQDSLMNNEFPGSDEDIFGDVQEEENNAAQPEKKVENVEDYIDYTGAPQKEDVKPQKTKKKKVHKKTPSRSSASVGYGSYFVVAGSYIVESNANKMKNKLANLGYNSEVVVFDLSQYYTVLAGRFGTRSEASQVVSRLRARGIDSYVQRKKG